METLTLAAEPRSELGRQAKQVRAQGNIPAVVYGEGVVATPIGVDARAFHKVFGEAGESTLIRLQIPGREALPVIIQEIAVHPVTGRVEHVDFRAVSLTQKISAEVNLEFTNASSAVKELGGTLVKQHGTIRVLALPQNLVHKITVDTGALKSFEDVIRVRDLVAPSGITFELGPDEIIAMVAAPRTEEEQKAEETAVPAEGKIAEVKVIAEEKKKERDAAKTEPKKAEPKEGK